LLSFLNKKRRTRNRQSLCGGIRMHKRAILGLAAVLPAAGIGCAKIYKADDEAIIVKLLR